MKYIIIGKIVNTHGIKGELRILSDFKYKDKIFKKGFPLYIGHTKEKEIINTYRPHKQFDMVTLNNYNNINEVLKYKGEYVFINKEDLELNSNQYLNEDLIGLEVITQNKSLGTLKKIEKYSSKYETLVVENNDKRILIPYNFDIIEKIDLDNKKIYSANNGIIEARGVGATAAPVNIVGIHTLSSPTNLNISLFLSAASTVTSFGTLIKIN